MRRMFKLPIRLIESSAAGSDWPELGPNETYIEIIAEGPGNKARKCWYGPEAIHDGKTAFRGVQVFCNHATESEREERPEGDVDKIIGRIKETFIVPGRRMRLMGVLKITEGKSFEKYKDLINESVKAEKEGFPSILSVSINADGKTQPRTIDGDQYNYVLSIPKAYSVDIVTKGGIKTAGFKHFIESDTLFPNVTKEGEINMKKKLTPEQKARFLEIQQTMLESMSDDDAEFYTETLAALSESDSDDEDFEDEDDGEEDNDTEETKVTLTLESGDTVEVGEPDEYSEEGNPRWILENGQVIELDAEAEVLMEGEDEGDSEDENLQENDMPEGLEELHDAYPSLVGRIMESESDPEKVLLKTKVALTESEKMAENLLRKNKVPRELLVKEDLIGLTESEMTRSINQCMRTVRFMESKQEANNALSGSSFRNTFGNGNTGSVGSRIMQNAMADE